MLIKDLLNHIETFAPLALALDWDNVGLLLGDRSATVNKALVTLDVTPNAVDKAIERGCDLIVSHHPLIFRPLKSLTDPLLLKLAARGIAVICLHTNLDVAPYGVNHALADALGLQVTGRLSLETGNRWQHISVTVPPAKAEDVARAAFAAGAGRIGNYGSCSTRHPITGTFLPGQGARPQLEQPDAQGLSRVEEVELEFMADSLCLPQVLQAIRARRESQIHDEAMILADTLVTETTLGTPLPDALRGYVQRHPQAHLAEEVRRFVLAPLASGESLVTLLNHLVEGPRYEPYPTFHRLLLQLARAVRGRLTPEETEHTLRAFLDTAEMVDEVQRELAVDVTQTRYSRWTVVAIIAGGILFMAFVMPDARQHWLHDLVGQVTMLLVSLFIALAVGLGERLSRMKGWRF